MRRNLILTSIVAAAAAIASSCAGRHAGAKAPEWLEGDSAQAISQRMLRDFSLTFDQGCELIMAEHPELTPDSILRLADLHYVELAEIDGQLRMHRKSPRNLNLLDPAYNGGWKHRGWDASPERLAIVDSIVRCAQGKLADGGSRRVRYRFAIDVPYDPALAGDTLRVWMPFPIESDRQSDVKLISCIPEEHVISEPGQSDHRTIYFARPVVEGDTARFEYVAEYTVQGAYFAPADILANLKPYDKESGLYKKYTAFDGPHYARLDSLAKTIVGDEDNPFRQSELVYDYIIGRYPWAGAREYSTIPCIPQYVLDQGHGDCGQVALLYISLMRTLGVPSRWESGWMLHPGEKNLHDWAETYYEGVGWVPVDVSFGRYATASSPEARNFYSTGIDAYRLAANKGVGEPFYPAKRHLRSETVDSQLGEVECSCGNLFYPGWDQSLEIISSHPIVKEINTLQHK